MLNELYFKICAVVTMRCEIECLLLVDLTYPNCIKPDFNGKRTELIVFYLPCSSPSSSILSAATATRTK
jgi:hypothetical protein